MANTAPIPADSTLVDTRINMRSGRPEQTGVISNAWYEYFVQAQQRLDSASTTLKAIFNSLTSQAASIATTSIPLPVLSSGLYRVSTYVRIMQAASTSSSLTVTLGWVDGTVGCTHTTAALTGNTTATTQSVTVMIRSDNSKPITYSTTYASSGGTAMQYRLDLAVEEVPT